MTTIVADIGSTHCGKFEYITELITTAKKCSVDIVKAQLFEGNMHGNIEFPRKLWKDTVALARETGIDIFASVFDHEAIDLLVESGIDKVKLSYNNAWNLKLLKHIRNYKDQGKIKEIWASGDCNSYPHYATHRLFRPEGYPPKTIQRPEKYNWDGISSHYLPPFHFGNSYKIYEIHMTLDKPDIDVPDHYFSYSPKELEVFCKWHKNKS